MKRASLLVATLVLAPAGARAERLDPVACDGLRGEQARLVAAGTRRDMERGPEWARANLGRDRLEQIAKLMSVEEQLIFRCAALQPQPAAGEEAGVVPAKPKPKAKHAKAAEGEPPAEAKPKKKKTPAAELEGGQAEEAPKPAKKKSKPAATSAEAAPAQGKGAGGPQP